MCEGSPKLDIRDFAAWITINRPQQKNRLEPDDLASLRQMFERISIDRRVRVVVLTAEGDIFSAGFNISCISVGDTGSALVGPGGFGAVADALENLPQPTIARLNGNVYGGASDLALACDFRIGIEGMQAVMPAARLGLHYYKSGIVRYVSRLGLDNAKRMFLTAEPVNAHELLRIGFLTQLVPAVELDNAVAELTDGVKRNAPLALQGVKLALNEFASNRWDEQVFLDRAHAALNSHDLQEGIAAFQQKRAPKFHGK